MRELFCQVGPGRVGLLDEPDFFLAAPALNFFFAGDGVANVAEEFEIHQTEDSVACGESWSEALAMLDHAALEAAGYARVEATRTVREDVDAVGPGHLIQK